MHLYRASIVGQQGSAIIDGLDHYSQNNSNSPSLILNSQSSTYDKQQRENSVSTTYSFARTWTINQISDDQFEDKVIRKDNKLYGYLIILRCIIRLILIILSIFGASFARIYTNYYLNKHNLSQNQWFKYQYILIWIIVQFIFDLIDWTLILIDLFCLDRNKSNSKTRKEIIKYHLSLDNNKSFILDLFASIPFELIFINNLNILLCVRTIKTLKICSFLTDFDYLLSDKYWNIAIYQHPISRNIFYSFLLFLTLIYIYGSIWFVIVANDESLEFINNFMTNDDMNKCFFTSIYYILVTMCAVGYGDITPQNIQQVGLIVIVEITGFIILTNIIGSFVPYFFQSMIEEFEFTHRRDLILRYLSKNGNDNKIKEKTQTYFSNLWQKCRGLNDNAIFSKYLPLHLRREVGDELVGSILREEKFFANAPSSFLRCLSDNLEFGFYLENDIIFHDGIILDKLPILLSGDVEEFTFDENNKRIMLRSITDGRLFAQNEFISAQPISSNFESKTNGLEIVFIHRTHWNQLLKQYPIVAAQIFEYTNKRNNARGVLKSPQSKKLQLFSTNDDDTDKQKSIEGLYLPHSRVKQRWNIANFFGLLMYIILNSMLISFSNSRELNMETWTILTMLWLTDIFFVFDVWFRKKKFAVKIGENVVSDPETVSKIYMKRDVYLDIFALIPFEFVILFIDPKYMVLGRINKYVRLFRFIQSFQDALDSLHCTGSKRNIVLTCSTITIMLHLMACLWYLVGGISHHVSGFDEKNWIYMDPAIDIESQTISRYIRSIYFAFLTSFTIGYGGIVPINFSEQLICMILIIIGTSSYFIMMALITVWAEQANKIALNFERNFEIVKHVLSELNVDENVNNDVRSFMSQLWSNQFGYRDETVLNLLPRNIRVSIMENLSLGVLGNITFFNNVPKGFMDELLLSFTIKSFCPNELMFSGNVVSDFFIVYQGTCVLKARVKGEGDDDKNGGDDKKKRRGSVVSTGSTDSASNIVVQALQTRDFFGLEALDLFNQVRDARKQKAKLVKERLDKERKEKQKKENMEDNNDGDENSDEVVANNPIETEEKNREFEELRQRKKRAKRHRLSYYTSFEFEEQALKNCPFDEFAVRADSSGFSTIISITNDEFEEVLKVFPRVKSKILKESEINNESLSSPASSLSQSLSKQNTMSQQKNKTSLISSANHLLKMDTDVEINFDNTTNPDFKRQSSSISSSIIHSARQSEMRNNKRKQRISRASLSNFAASELNGASKTGSITNNKQMNPDSNNFYEFFGLIHPLSDIKLWWNIISLLFCLYNMMIVPYRIAFINEPFDGSTTAGFILFDVILDLFFCFDVYMRFDRFTFIEEGFVEPNKSVIRARYIGYKLFLDLISSLPWDLIVVCIIIGPKSWNLFWSDNKIKIYFWLRLLRLLRWHNFKGHINEIDQFIEDRRIRIKPTMLRITYQLIFVLIVCHWGASVFYFIANETFNTDTESNWLRSPSTPVFYDGSSDYQLPEYLLSAYWSLITMSSVGFGDIKPQTFAETCCGLIIMILGVLAYATTTAFIASFAAHANPPSESFREKSQPIEKYLKTLKLSTKLKERSNSYFNELWKRFKGVSPLTAISCVSDSLQIRILESILFHRLAPLDIFRDAPKNFIKTCAQNMRHELYIQGEKIVYENTENYKMYLLFEGTAKGTSGARDGRIYVAGTTFSKQALINTGWIEPGTIEASKNCHCFTLKREEFADIVASKKEWRKYLYSSNFVGKTNSIVKGNFKKLRTFSLTGDEINASKKFESVDIENSILKLFTFIALVFNLWMNSFQFAFLSKDNDYTQTMLITAILSWSTDIIFMVDWLRILLFVKAKNLEQNQKHSYKANIKAYFKESPVDFMVHVLILLPIDLILYFSVNAFVATLFRFITRIYHLGQLSELLNGLFRRIKANPVQKLLIQMVLIIYLSLHNLSCIFSVVVGSDDIFGVLTYETPFEHYLLSIYFVITVVTTTGYGDITPQNFGQIIFTIILIFCGNMIYAGTIGTISSWVGSTYSRILEHFNQLKELEAFCENKKLNGKLAEKILVHHNESFNQRSREQTMKLFPQRLQRQCSFEIYGKFIGSFEYFQYLSSTQMQTIVRNISTQTYLKGDVILSRGDLNDNLHILLSGKVFLVKYKENRSNSIVALPSRRSSLNIGSWFGDFSFFMSQPCAISAIAASDSSETMYISRDILSKIIGVLNTDSNDTTQPKKQKKYLQSLEKYFHHVQKTNAEKERENEFEQVESEVVDKEQITVQVDDDQNENKEKNTDDQETDSHKTEDNDFRTHPFMIFLAKFLETNPNTSKKLIQDAAQFWKIKMQHVQILMDEARDNYSDPTPIESPRKMSCVQEEQDKDEEKQDSQDKEEQEMEEEQDEEENEENNEIEEQWIDDQLTFYEGMFDNIDTSKLKEIQHRFKNHDKQNTANCIVM